MRGRGRPLATYRSEQKRNNAASVGGRSRHANNSNRTAKKRYFSCLFSLGPQSPVIISGCGESRRQCGGGQRYHLWRATYYVCLLQRQPRKQGDTHLPSTTSGVCTKYVSDAPTIFANACISVGMYVGEPCPMTTGCGRCTLRMLDVFCSFCGGGPGAPSAVPAAVLTCASEPPGCWWLTADIGRLMPPTRGGCGRPMVADGGVDTE